MDIVVASNDADVHVRTVAVRDMLSTLEKGGIDADELVRRFPQITPRLETC